VLISTINRFPWRLTVAANPTERRVNSMYTTYIHHSLDLVHTHGVAYAVAYLSYQGVEAPTVQRILFGQGNERRLLASQQQHFTGTEGGVHRAIKEQQTGHSFWMRARTPPT
jgi:hypothetical protein